MAAIGEDVLAVLSAAACEGNRLVLAGQLDRKLYVDTNKVLASLGGTWDRKAKAHLFPGDAAERIEQALLTGSYERPRDFDFFETPAPLAARLVDLADLRPGDAVLEPSAGKGAILDALAAHPARRMLAVDCAEINPERQRVLVDKGYPPVAGDFLAYRDWHGDPLRYDRIVMNPPFSRQQDLAHVMHAYDLLAPGGRVVAVMAAGVTFRQDRKTADFRALPAGFGRIEPNPAGSFKASGTEVNTVTVVLDKPENN